LFVFKFKLHIQSWNIRKAKHIIVNYIAHFFSGAVVAVIVM